MGFFYIRYFFTDRVGDIESAGSSTVQRGASIALVSFSAAASVRVDSVFGQREPEPPTQENVGCLCIWVGEHNFENKRNLPSCCLVRLVSIKDEGAVVRTLKARDGRFIGITKDFVE